MIDRNKVMILYRNGKTYEEIATEMNCSSKQAGRIVRAKKNELVVELHKHSRKDNQDMVLLCMAACGYSSKAIAEKIGSSRQAIHEKLNDYYQYL